jgi:uracil phosphoribosyltransferase
MINVLTHSLLEHYLTILRTKPTLPHFRFALGKVCQLVSVLVTSNLPLDEFQNPKDENTPYLKYTEQSFLLAIVPSGLPLEEAFRKVLPNSQTGFIAYENTANTPEEVLCYLPKDIKNRRTYILDFGILTGKTISSAISRLKFEEVSEISVVTIFATAEGIENIHSEFPDIPITICSLENIEDRKRDSVISDFFVSYNTI